MSVCCTSYRARLLVMEVVVYWFLSSLVRVRYCIFGPRSGVSLSSLLSLESSVASRRGEGMREKG